jgi:hypothetical protein
VILGLAKLSETRNHLASFAGSEKNHELTWNQYMKTKHGTLVGVVAKFVDR